MSETHTRGIAGAEREGATPIFISRQKFSVWHATAQILNSRSSKSKHFNISLFYVRDLVDRGLITIIYVKTILNRSDMMTKPLAYPVLYKFTSKLFLIEDWYIFDLTVLCLRRLFFRTLTYLWSFFMSKNPYPIENECRLNLLNISNGVRKEGVRRE